MPTERLSMRKIRDVLRLKFESGLSERVIARSMSLSNGSVNSYLQRARMAGLRWPLPDDLDDGALERLLFPPAATAEAARARPRPGWADVDKDMRRKGVTLALLWEEYRAAHPDGFGYSWFCEHYDAFKSRLRPTMRQSHAAGEKVFVDFAGDAIDIVDPTTGEVRPMKLFVAVMGASNYIFAQARPSEQIADWIGAHVRPVRLSGRRPEVAGPRQSEERRQQSLVPYDPGINRTYRRDGGCTTAWRSFRRGRTSRETRRRLHIASCLINGVVMDETRAGRGLRPGRPLVIVRLGGMSHKPRLRLSHWILVMRP